MLTLIQRVTYAQVEINNKVVAEIQRGILALIGFEKTDTEQHANKLIDKILNYRIFPDAEGKTNLNLRAIEGGLLLVPQFTLVADTNKGNRPGFSKGMSPEDGKDMFEYLVSAAIKRHDTVQSGKFGDDMKIKLCNDGPMTFIININR